MPPATARFPSTADVSVEKGVEGPGLVRTTTLTAFRAYSKADEEQAWDIGAG